MTAQSGQPSTVPPRRPSKTRRVGRVTSDVRDKTIRVEVAYAVRHDKYGKFLRRRSVYHAHDENNEARLGDTVEIVETRPISRQKRWRLVRVVAKAPEQAEIKA